MEKVFFLITKLHVNRWLNNIDTVKTWQSENFCVKLISMIIICYVCSVRLLRLVTPLCVCIVCSCLHFLIKSALLLASIVYHSW